MLRATVFPIFNGKSPKGIVFVESANALNIRRIIKYFHRNTHFTNLLFAIYIDICRISFLLNSKRFSIITKSEFLLKFEHICMIMSQLFKL